MSHRDLTIDFYLLGEVGFARFMALQRRLADSASSGLTPSLPVIFCEHPPLITVGRSGSRSHIRFSNDELLKRGIEIEWVSRGGGCVPHGPGQLCVYPIVPLREVGWTIGNYLRRFQEGITKAIQTLNLPASHHPGTHNVWGQSGLLAAVGVQVHNGITQFGTYLNVGPDMSVFRFVDTVPLSVAKSISAVARTSSTAHTPRVSSMSCLAAERRGAVNMSRVRTAVIESLSESFGATEHQIHAGHPWLRAETRSASIAASRRAV